MTQIEEMDDALGCIYYLHAGDYVPRYIGQTVVSPKARFQSHQTHARHNSPLPVHRWMRKAGIDNVQICVIEFFNSDSIQWIDAQEVFYIAQYRDLPGKKLLNLAEGGRVNRGFSRRPETKQKISESQTGKRNHRYGKPMHPNTREGLLTALVGREVSDETRAKISEANRGNATRAGQVNTPEHRAKISAALKGRPPRGNHTRWHVERDLVNPTCIYCKEGSK